MDLTDNGIAGDAAKLVRDLAGAQSLGPKLCQTLNAIVAPGIFRLGHGLFYFLFVRFSDTSWSRGGPAVLCSQGDHVIGRVTGERGVELRKATGLDAWHRALWFDLALSALL
ncbi:hypothetical protein SAMN03159448_03943 [Sinorhizobium sp. NFACC03]|nr:hypothetical protein SAMN03159448_03943 [Sinorhizobium sp. NFACC03]